MLQPSPPSIELTATCHQQVHPRRHRLGACALLSTFVCVNSGGLAEDLQVASASSCSATAASIGDRERSRALLQLSRGEAEEDLPRGNSTSFSGSGLNGSRTWTLAHSEQPTGWEQPFDVFIRDPAVVQNRLLSLFLYHWDAAGRLSVYKRPHNWRQCNSINEDNSCHWAHDVGAVMLEAKALLQNPTNVASVWQPHDWVQGLNQLEMKAVHGNCPAPVMVFTGNASKACQILTPNIYELRGLVSQMVQTAARQYLPLSQRPAKVFWRGGDLKPVSCENAMRGQDPRRQLVSLSQTVDGSKWIDAKFSSDVPLEAYARSAKYLIDIGGNSCTTWNAFRWKLASGALVFRVVMPGGLKDWTDAFFQPHQHYIPVKSDLSDLRAWFDWAESRPKEALAIAQRGASASVAITDDVIRHGLVDSLVNGGHMAYLPHVDESIWDCYAGACRHDGDLESGNLISMTTPGGLSFME